MMIFGIMAKEGSAIKEVKLDVYSELYNKERSFEVHFLSALSPGLISQ